MPLKETNDVGKKTTDVKTGKRKTQVKDLPRGEKELTTDEQKKVAGGATRAVQPGIRTYPTGGGTSSSG